MQVPDTTRQAELPFSGGWLKGKLYSDSPFNVLFMTYTSLSAVGQGVLRTYFIHLPKCQGCAGLCITGALTPEGHLPVLSAALHVLGALMGGREREARVAPLPRELLAGSASPPWLQLPQDGPALPLGLEPASPVGESRDCFTNAS